MVKKIMCYKCMDCKNIYLSKRDAEKCESKDASKCSANYKGFHSWNLIITCGNMNYYKCKNCNKDLITTYQTKKRKKKESPKITATTGSKEK